MYFWVVRERIKEPQVLCDPWPKTVKANSNDQHEMTARKKNSDPVHFSPEFALWKTWKSPADNGEVWNFSWLTDSP